MTKWSMMRVGDQCGGCMWKNHRCTTYSTNDHMMAPTATSTGMWYRVVLTPASTTHTMFMVIFDALLLSTRHSADRKVSEWPCWKWRTVSPSWLPTHNAFHLQLKPCSLSPWLNQLLKINDNVLFYWTAWLITGIGSTNCAKLTEDEPSQQAIVKYLFLVTGQQIHSFIHFK